MEAERDRERERERERERARERGKGGGLLGSLKVYAPLAHLLVPLVMCVLGFICAWLAATDVTVAALCDGREQCSEVIYLSTVKSAVAAFGTMFITPWLGGLSDIYGRKPFLMMLFFSFSLPNGVLAFSSSRLAVYIYFMVATIVYMFGEGSFSTLFYAYVADTIPEESRALAFGLVGGLSSIGFLGGTLLARLLPTRYIFHCAAGFCWLAVAYIALFMPESLPRLRERERERERALLEEGAGKGGEPPKQPQRPTTPRSVRDTLKAIGSSRLLAVLAGVAFLAGMGEAGYFGSFLFFLKAAFHWGKNEFSMVTLVAGTSTALSQLVVLPILLRFFGLKTLLVIGLFFGALHVVLYGAAWAPWVVYLAATMPALSGMTNPVIGTIVSRCASPDEQGRLQGVVMGIKSISAFLAPLTINPITAVFLSDNPPFNCPGFGLIVAGTVEFGAFLLTFALPSLPRRGPPPGEAGGGYAAIPTNEEEGMGTAANASLECAPLDYPLLAHNIMPEVEPP